ncbi:hypothetical protein ACPPVO_36825 [Dactylosporangium sp. McL0621]|uniref:hypothetical protein n=1 Tax=Dactylosporangium sp. McL0621 TaxID=3415678 RepID=UPI003CED4E0D
MDDSYADAFQKGRGFSMLTPGWYERPGLRRAAPALDTLAGRVPGSAPWAVNVVYAARRTHPR